MDLETYKTVDKLAEITDKLEKGIAELFESESYTNYLTVMSKFHNYSFNNSMLIAMQRPDATYVAGYDAWQKNFERHVNKGEQGIKIISPAPYKQKKLIEKIDPATGQTVMGRDGQPVMDQIEVVIPSYKVSTVFDISQTEGKPLPELVATLDDSVENYELFMGAIRELSPVNIDIRHFEGDAKGYFSKETKEIVIKDNLSQLQTIKTAIHEVSHAMLHDFDRTSEENKSLDRGTKEVQAESVAYTVCKHYGLDTDDYSFGYIASWSKGKELDELKHSMNVIRNTAADIINKIDNKLARQMEKTLTDEKVPEMTKEVLNNEMVKVHHRSHRG